MDKNEQQTLITEIINNDKLRGSLYSTFRCSCCGEKLSAKVVGECLCLECESGKNDYKSYYENNCHSKHDIIYLELKEIAAILNYNPLL